MAEPASNGRSTRVTQVIPASRETVYGAFLDPNAVTAWLPPDGMTGTMHAFEPHTGGRFSMSLTYINEEDSQRGKTSDDTDTFEGTFSELVSNRKIVWTVEFESDSPDLAGEMTVSWLLADAPGGTEVTALCEGIPAGIKLVDNELGSRLSLRKLSAFILEY